MLYQNNHINGLEDQIKKNDDSFQFFIFWWNNQIDPTTNLIPLYVNEKNAGFAFLSGIK